MSDFEKQYYEDPAFWSDGMLTDPANLERMDLTMGLIDGSVKSLLDVGCGNGVFLDALAKKRPDLQLMGVDRSVEALKYVKQPSQVGDITDIGVPPGSYDCVSCLEVLEHIPIPNFDKALSELANASGRFLLISVPYNEDLQDSYTQCPACQSIFNKELHLRSFSEKKFSDLFNANGFTCRAIKYAGKGVQFKYHKRYRKLVNPKEHERWLSPVCPICGYVAPSAASATAHAAPAPAAPQGFSPVRMAKDAVKRLWPKEESYYWIIGLFERTSG